MLEEVNRVGTLKPKEHREVAPVTPYPRINPKQERQEGYSKQQQGTPYEENIGVRRRFTAMRNLIEQLKEQTTISRVDYNTANQELVEQGLAVIQDALIPLLLRLKIPLDSIDELVLQLQQRRASPTLSSGQDILAESTPFPIFVEHLAEYLLGFERLEVRPGKQNPLLIDAINNQGHYQIRQKQLRLDFTRPAGVPELGWKTLELAVHVQIGAVEIDENGRRAILYQRPDKTYGLYSDKTISLSI